MMVDNPLDDADAYPLDPVSHALSSIVDRQTPRYASIAQWRDTLSSSSRWSMPTTEHGVDKMVTVAADAETAIRRAREIGTNVTTSPGIYADEDLAEALRYLAPPYLHKLDRRRRKAIIIELVRRESIASAHVLETEAAAENADDA